MKKICFLALIFCLSICCPMGDLAFEAKKNSSAGFGLDRQDFSNRRLLKKNKGIDTPEFREECAKLVFMTSILLAFGVGPVIRVLKDIVKKTKKRFAKAKDLFWQKKQIKKLREKNEKDLFA